MLLNSNTSAHEWTKMVPFVHYCQSSLLGLKVSSQKWGEKKLMEVEKFSGMCKKVCTPFLTYNFFTHTTFSCSIFGLELSITIFLKIFQPPSTFSHLLTENFLTHPFFSTRSFRSRIFLRLFSELEFLHAHQLFHTPFLTYNFFTHTTFLHPIFDHTVCWIMFAGLQNCIHTLHTECTQTNMNDYKPFYVPTTCCVWCTCTWLFVLVLSSTLDKFLFVHMFVKSGQALHFQRFQTLNAPLIFLSASSCTSYSLDRYTQL